MSKSAILGVSTTSIRPMTQSTSIATSGAIQSRWDKTANILNKLPKSQQPKAKRMLQDIWMAKTRKDAEATFDVFVETYGVKYEKAAECLKKKDRDSLLVARRPSIPNRRRLILQAITKNRR